MTYKLTDEDRSFVGLGRVKWEAERMKNINPDAPENSDRFSISKHWVSIVTSGFNQDINCLINGRKGWGKSNFMLAELRRCADMLANRLGGQSDDYFTVDRNMCIMDQDTIIETLTNPEKYQCIGLDDAGTINGARLFRTGLNQWVNNIMVTNRPQHNIVIQSAPDQGHIDKQAREIGDYYIEMQENKACRAHNFNLLKFFIREKHYRKGIGIFRYPRWYGEVVSLIVVERAKKKDEEEYDKKREIYIKKCWNRGVNKKDNLTDVMSSQELRMFENENKMTEKTTAKTWCERRQPWFKKRKEDVLRRVAAAEVKYDLLRQTTNMTHCEILTKIGVSVSTWHNWNKRGLLSVEQIDGRYNKYKK